MSIAALKVATHLALRRLRQFLQQERRMIPTDDLISALAANLKPVKRLRPPRSTRRSFSAIRRAYSRHDCCRLWLAARPPCPSGRLALRSEFHRLDLDRYALAAGCGLHR